MSDTTHEAPERVYMIPSFAAGLKNQPRYSHTVEYVLKSHSDNLVQAAVTTALEVAAGFAGFVQHWGNAEEVIRRLADDPANVAAIIKKAEEESDA